MHVTTCAVVNETLGSRGQSVALVAVVVVEVLGLSPAVLVGGGGVSLRVCVTG